MADKNEFDDEYQFSELEEPNQSMNKLSSEPDTAGAGSQGVARVKETNVRRNALIVIGVVVISMILYKFVGALMTNKKLIDSETPPQSQAVAIDNSAAVPNTTPTPTVQAEVPTVIEPAPVVPQAQSPEVMQQLAALQMAQQNLRRDVDTLNTQLSGLNNQLTDLSGKMAQLTATMVNLSSTVELQVQKVQALMPKPKIVKRSTGQAAVMVTYSIQAIIPGRAWLIAQNGSTITVREGTSIPGYGLVKLVDPIQGQVLTSTGKIIKFSQSDS